jgi:hypothetical protein
MRQAGWQYLKGEVGAVEERLLGQWRPAMFAEVDQGQWMKRLCCEPRDVSIGDSRCLQTAQRRASG